MHHFPLKIRTKVYTFFNISWIWCYVTSRQIKVKDINFKFLSGQPVYINTMLTRHAAARFTACIYHGTLSWYQEGKLFKFAWSRSNSMIDLLFNIFNNVISSSLGVWKCNSPACLGNYDRQTDKQTNQHTDGKGSS